MIHVDSVWSCSQSMIQIAWPCNALSSKRLWRYVSRSPEACLEDGVLLLQQKHPLAFKEWDPTCPSYMGHWKFPISFVFRLHRAKSDHYRSSRLLILTVYEPSSSLKYSALIICSQGRDHCLQCSTTKIGWLTSTPPISTEKSWQTPIGPCSSNAALVFESDLSILQRISVSIGRSVHSKMRRGIMFSSDPLSKREWASTVRSIVAFALPEGHAYSCLR